MTSQQWTRQTEPRPLWGSTPCVCLGWGWVPTKGVSDVPSGGHKHGRGHGDEAGIGCALSSVDREALAVGLVWFEWGFERASCNASRKKKDNYSFLWAFKVIFITTSLWFMVLFMSLAWLWCGGLGDSLSCSNPSPPFWSAFEQIRGHLNKWRR